MNGALRTTFVIGNAWIQQPKRRKWTWKSPSDGSRKEIDYILISKRFRNALLSAKTYPEADFYSDHVPVAAKFKLKLKKTRSKSKNIKLCFASLKSDQTLREKNRVAAQHILKS